jgi:uncharacterized membrane protein
LVEATEFNGLTLWAIAIFVTVLVVLVVSKLRSLARWRAAVFGVAVMLFAAPVYAVAFDPWWAAPWPSVYITAALVSGEWGCGIAFFERAFVLPPIGWGMLSGLAWRLGPRLSVARRHDTPPPFV